MDDKVKICFDKDYKIRIMDPIKFERSEQLDLECNAFMESMLINFFLFIFFLYSLYCVCFPCLQFILILEITSFNDKVTELVKVLESHAERIDEQKLKVR